MEILKQIEKLSETTVPTILVIAGIIFLFFALGGQFGAKIVTDKIKPKYSGILGILFLLIGIVIYTGLPNVNGNKQIQEKFNVNGVKEIQARIEELQKDIEHINKRKREIEARVEDLNKRRESNGELDPEVNREIDKHHREIGELNRVFGDIEIHLKENQRELNRIRENLNP